MGTILSILNALTNILIIPLCVFLIGIILIQRGKGGGLAGAFGGVGGSSAFGTKAGDVFTRVTVGVAIVWIAMSMLMVVLTDRRNDTLLDSDFPSARAKQLQTSTGRSAKDIGTLPSKNASPSSSTAPRSSSSRGESAEIPIPTEVPNIPVIPEPSSTPTPSSKNK